MQTFLRDTRQALGQPVRPSPGASTRREQKGHARSLWPTIGFWVGGGTLGTVGFVLGVCVPYHHPVVVAISAIWWGIYLGCLGGSVGALVGLLTKRNPAPPTRETDEPGCGVWARSEASWP
jgi:hypothetical protein